MPHYSVVIPVYRSQEVLARTVERTVAALQGLDFEIILVNDGSPDQSWMVIHDLTTRYEQVKGVNLLKNYGQHTAVFCGIAESKGDYIITMDDDLQNPPEDIALLIQKIQEGFDVVFAVFEEKKHSLVRRIGSKFIGWLNTKIFDKPKNLHLTNFRIFTRETAQRMLSHRTFYPYIPGLLLIYSSKRANVLTRHNARNVGESNYNLWRIASLMARLLFNYSSYPLKVASFLGITVSALSFIYGCGIAMKAMFMGSSVQGWTTIVVLLSFLSGFILVVLGIMGEYLSRLMNQMATTSSYQIREKVG